MCKFDIDTEGRFVQGSLPEVTMKLLKVSRAPGTHQDVGVHTHDQSGGVENLGDAVGSRPPTLSALSALLLEES